MGNYTYKNTKTVNLNNKELLVSFYVNDLVEKRVNIYYRRGPKGTANYQCGREKFKLRKENFTWQKINEKCRNGNEIYKITRRTS